VQRYGSLIFESRTGNSEAYLAEDLEDLVIAVCDSLGSHSFASADCAQPPPASSFMWDIENDYGWTGPYCRDIGMNCQADQQEAALPFSSPRFLDTDLKDRDGNVIIKGLKGSAGSYASTVANTDKFFVYYFAWDCDVLSGVPGGEYCVAIPDDLLPPDEGDPSLRRTFTIALRDYIAVGTQSGPDSSKLLTPRIFTFAPRR